MILRFTLYMKTVRCDKSVVNVETQFISILITLVAAMVSLYSCVRIYVARIYNIVVSGDVRVACGLYV